MVACGKCSKELSSQQDILTCMVCKESYQSTCTRVKSEENFKKLSLQKKAVWKCDLCKSESDKELTFVLERVITGLRNDITAQINTVSNNIDGIREQLQGVNATIAGLQTTVNTLVTENESRKDEHNTLVHENEEMKETVVRLENRVINLEQYSRRESIEIVGVPYSTNENMYYLLERLATAIRLKFNRWEISVAHRLPVSKERPNPSIIVKFVARDAKYTWMRAARDCRKRLTAAELCDSWGSTPIFVNDHLIPHYKTILGRARRLVKEKKLAFAWSSDCRIFARKSADQSCKPTLLRTMDDLDRLLIDG